MSLRQHALEIFQAALAASDPAESIRRYLDDAKDRFAAYRNIWLVGGGKAGAQMAAAVEDVLGDRIAGGAIAIKDGHAAAVRRVALRECSHPVPDERGVAAAREILHIAQAAGAEDLVICCLSGGASALLPLPAEGITLADKQETTRLLLASGASIHEINAVRKHLSAIKGGQLATAAAPARVLSLILSDVIGNNLDVIGSGVTAPDSSTYASATEVLRKYGILDKAPGSVRERLADPASRETPKEVPNTINVIVGSSDLALTAAAEKAKALGYNTLVLSSFIEGETRDVARVHAAIAKEIDAFSRPLPRPACLISGGETTVTIRGDGKGGRNQEFVLAAAIDIAGMRDVCVLSAGTDGTDGPTDAAGAICDGETLGRAPKAATYLSRNDAYPYFDALGDLIKTGPTGTNVMDVRIVLAG
ncbi:MAG TPA: glycerate kinase [Bryobacteraceae bacterium]|nr:glycerate kinase [Bryobacteraceae bacterium]